MQNEKKTAFNVSTKEAKKIWQFSCTSRQLAYVEKDLDNYDKTVGVERAWNFRARAEPEQGALFLLKSSLDVEPRAFRSGAKPLELEPRIEPSLGSFHPLQNGHENDFFRSDDSDSAAVLWFIGTSPP